MAKRNVKIGSSSEQVNRIVGRLSSMVTRIYGGDLTFLSVDEFSESFKRRYASQLKQARWSIVEKEFLYCSVTNQGKLSGACRVRLERPLSHSEITQLHTTLQMTMGSVLASQQRLETIETLEKQLDKISSTDLAETYFQNWPTESLPITIPVQSDSPEWNLPCLVLSSSADMARRVAFEIHNLSDRFAFISIHDIDLSSLENPKNIFELGRISLLIPEVTELNPTDQAGLLEYLASMPGREGPTILAMSTRNLGELKSASLVLPKLFDLLSRGLVVAPSYLKSYQTTEVAKSYIAALSSQPHDSSEALI